MADFAADSKDYIDSLDGWKKEGAMFAMSAVTGPVKATVGFAVGKGIELAAPESAQQKVAEISGNITTLAGEGGVSVLTDKPFSEVDQKYEEGHQRTNRRVDGIGFFADQVFNILPSGKGKKNSNNHQRNVDEANGNRTTSREARRESMRQQGIPTSQQPLSQSKNDSGREYTYETSASGGGQTTKSVQQQTMDRSHPDQSHWEAGQVKTDPLTGEVRMNEYGRPKLTNDKSKVDYDE